VGTLSHVPRCWHTATVTWPTDAAFWIVCRSWYRFVTETNCFFCSQVPNDAHNLQPEQDVSTHTLSLHSAMFTSTAESPLGAQVKNSTPRCVSGKSTELHAAQFALKRRFVLSTQIGRHRFWATLGTRHLKWAAQAEGTVLRRRKGKNV